MLTVSEKEGFRQILKKLPYDEVLSLKDTVTKKQISADGKTEAITAIITYTESAIELLKRKKLKREHIFQYLAEKGVVASVGAEKYQLIKKVLLYWGTKYDHIEASEEEDTLPLVAFNSDSSDASVSDTQSMGQLICNRLPARAVVVEGPSDQLTLTNGQANRQPVSVDYQCVTLNSVGQSSEVAAHPCQQNATTSVESQNPSAEHWELAKQFVQWFFKTLNSHNPLVQDTPEGDFGPQHFWTDCRLQLQCTVQGDVNTETFEGAFLVSQRFLAFVKEEMLLFNPNLNTDGIKVKSEPHGLILVMTCGTVHRVRECMGVFEQVFGIVNDPIFDNNWKIKMCQLKMRSSQQTTMPRLEDGETFPALLSS